MRVRVAGLTARGFSDSEGFAGGLTTGGGSSRGGGAKASPAVGGVPIGGVGIDRSGVRDNSSKPATVGDFGDSGGELE